MTLQEICKSLSTAYENTTPGIWQQGLSSHHTVTETGYKIGEFHHASDAEFCDTAHDLVPKVIQAVAQMSEYDPNIEQPTTKKLREAFAAVYKNDEAELSLAENNKDYWLESIVARHKWRAFQEGAKAYHNLLFKSEK